jgi:hypothetical protein
MKTAKEIHRKLKEAKFRHWLVIYKRMTRRTPFNCRYNCQYELYWENKKVCLGLCLIHQDNIDINKIYPHLVDLCYTNDNCSNCNGFVHKYTRDQIKEIFIQELNNKSIKEKKYPDICALEWVLDKYNEGYPPISNLTALYYQIKKLLLKK